MKISFVLTGFVASIFLTKMAECEVTQLIQRDQQCPVFQCSPDNRLEGMDLCFKADLQDPGFVHLKKCNEGKMCHGKLNRCSNDPYNQYEGKLPGQLCDLDFQCLSQECVESEELNDGRGYCSGFVESSSCEADNQCNPGLFCDSVSQKCLRQKSEQEICTKESECLNSLTCTNNKCLPYGSLGDYEESDNSLACRSGFINQSEYEQTVCVPSPKIVNQLGPDYKCQSSQDTCKYEFTDSYSSLQTFELQCQCGFNPSGSSFCPTIYTQTYTTLLAEITSKLSVNCHTSGRTNIYECLYMNIKSQEDVSLLNSFIIEHYERESNSQVRENDKCMRKHSQVSQYWDAKINQTINPDLHAPMTRASATIVKRPSFFVLILCFIVMIFLSNK